MPSAKAMIGELALTRHPEGGWYRETWRGAAADGGRGTGSAILFLLEAGEASHWHRIDATEIWLFQAGAPLLLHTAGDAQSAIVPIRLGPNPLIGHRLQHVIEPGVWQAAQADEGWSLIACIVVPAFEFTGFELAAPGWTPG